MVQHNMKILYLRNANFAFKPGEVNEIDQDYLDNGDYIKLTVKQLCKDIQDRMKFHKDPHEDH